MTNDIENLKAGHAFLDAEVVRAHKRVDLLEQREGKPWWTSKSIWSNLVSKVALISAVYGHFYAWPAELMAGLMAVAAGGNVTSIFGRIVAKEPIK